VRTDIFHSPKRRIVRAKEHIRNLESRIKLSLKKDPGRHVTELNADGTKEIHKIRFTKPLPERASELALEAAEALRSALDQTGFAVAKAAGNTRLKATYFPIADSAAELENVIKRRCRDVPSDIVTFFRTLAPYQGGNAFIWPLNKLANSSKHTVVLEPAILSLGQIHFARAVLPGGTEFFSRWDSHNNEIAFAAIPIGTNPQYDAQISFGAAFGEIDAVRGQPAISLLNEMASEVERIVLATEAEARRLGLIT
jgi:hypothetical protein